MEAGEQELALKIASQELDDDPENLLAAHIIQRCFVELERPGLARIVGKYCVDRNPKEAGSWIGLGNAYQINYDLDNAEKCLKHALSLEPRNFSALNNLSLTYVNKAEPDKAISFAQRSLNSRPELIDAYENMGFAYLMKQDWVKGWAYYNVGVGRSSDRKIRFPELPQWDGTKGQKVIVFGEQGLGDEIAFASAIPDMMKDVQVTIECSPQLEGLFRRSFNCPVYGTRYREPTWFEQTDARISMGQVMEFYRTKTEAFHGKPYLTPDPERRGWWKAILAQYPGKKIGIAWHGGIRRTGEKRRSIDLEDFLPLMKGDTFVSLEYKDRKDELKEFEQKHGIRILDFSRYINHKDYDDTAALVAELDHVVSVTTAVVDLCGAIGQTCDVLVPDKPHWRYYGRMVWYDSINIIRQRGTWKDTIRANFHRVRPATADSGSGTSAFTGKTQLQGSTSYQTSTKPITDYQTGAD